MTDVTRARTETHMYFALGTFWTRNGAKNAVRDFTADLKRRGAKGGITFIAHHRGFCVIRVTPAPDRSMREAMVQLWPWGTVESIDWPAGGSR